MNEISSKSNEKIKNIQKLMKSSKARKEQGLFVVEGIRMFVEIPKNDLHEIYFTEEAYQKYEVIKNVIDSIDAHVECYKVTEQIFKSMSDTGTPQGILALVKSPQYSILDAVKRDRDNCSNGNRDRGIGEERDSDFDLNNEEAPLILILEKLQDPGNMGTIIRTAEGAGVDCIIVSGDSVDIYNPKTVRSTMGAIFRMKVITTDNIRKDIEVLKTYGVAVFAAHLKGEYFYEKDFTKPTAFMIGNEGNGLSDEISALADDLIRIPMKGKLESLNAATSATLVAYEALRQRMM